MFFLITWIRIRIPTTDPDLKHCVSVNILEMWWLNWSMQCTSRGSSINISNATIIDKAIPESVPLVIYVVRPRNVFNRRLLGRLPFPGLVRGHSGSVGIIACIFFLCIFRSTLYSMSVFFLFFLGRVCGSGTFWLDSYPVLFDWIRIRYFLTGFVSGV